MDGLGSFIEIDNRSAVDVGQLREGTRPFAVQKPNFREEYREAAISEGPDELTFRAEEVDSLKACNNIDHIERGRWRPPVTGKSCTVTTQR